MKIKDILEGEYDSSKGRNWLGRQGERLGKWIGDLAQGEAEKIRRSIALPQPKPLPKPQQPKAMPKPQQPKPLPKPQQPKAMPKPEVKPESAVKNRINEMRMTDIIRTVLDIVDQAEQPAQEPVVAIAVDQPDQETMDMQALAGILNVGDSDMCGVCGRDLCGCNESGYANEPNEMIAPIQAAFPSGTDLNREKKQNPVGGFTGDNPMARK